MYKCYNLNASQVAQWLKNPPAIQETEETWIQSLSWEDSLEEEMATCFSILAWKILWIEEPRSGATYRSRGHRDSDMAE